MLCVLCGKLCAFKQASCKRSIVAIIKKVFTTNKQIYEQTKAL